MNNKIKIIAIVLGALFIIGNTGYFFSHYQLQFFSPVKIGFQKPVKISKRETVININTTVVKASENVSPLTDDQQFACNLFGKDCAIALAIMRAESHYRHDALNINSNGTADIGCFQINTIHLAKIDTSNLNLFNCQDSAKAAYAIYKQQKGFGAWVTYTSGIYKQYLIN